MINFAILTAFSLRPEKIISNHPIPIIGNASASTSNLNPKRVINRGVKVVPIFAHTTTPNAFAKPIIQAPTNHIVSIVTIVLL